MAIEAFAAFLWPLALLIEPYNLELQSHCATDPPPMPVFTPLDMAVAAVGIPHPDFTGTNQKIAALLANWAWPLYCECVDGFVPPPVAPPLPPADSSYGSNVDVRPCSMGGWAGIAPLGNGEPAPSNTGLNVGYRILPSDGTTRTFTVANSTYVGYRRKAGVTDAKWTRKPAAASLPTTSVGPNVLIQEWTDTNTLVRSHALDYVANSPQQSGTFSLGSNSTWLTAYAGAQAILGAFDNITDPLVTVNMEWFCGQAPGTLSDCCPPDPSIALTLNNLVTIVTDIQHRLGDPAVGYRDGAVHANLSGTGSFVLAEQALALRVTVASNLPATIVIPGTPSYYYDLGFITPYAAESPLRSTRLTFNPMTIPLPVFTEQIGYTLLNGVVVNITELVADAGTASP